jgi:hypothetical protein
MKRLPFYIVLLHSLFLGIEPSAAQQLSEKRVTDTSLLGSQPKIWVLKDNKPKRQPFVWVVKDP